MSKIMIFGLGPGPPELISKEVWELLESTDRIWVRTAMHSAVAGIQERLEIEINSFDDLYDRSASFEQVYSSIVQELIDLVDSSGSVVYGVPGNPLVGEASVSELLDRTDELGISTSILHGISFIEPCLRLAEIDALDGLFVLDAIDLARAHHPQFPPDAPALVGQIHSRLTASDVKLTLLNQYPETHPVRLITDAGMQSESIVTFPLSDLDHEDRFSLTTTLLVPALDKPSAFERFQETVAHLRAPEGCPWDREQTHETLRSHILEEAYETLQAIDNEDMSALQEELGDLLLQIVLQAQIAAEEGVFRMADVIASIQEKLVRRHPHVFDNLDVESVDQVLHNWEALKERERKEEGSEGGVLDGVPVNLPALAQASEIQDRVVRVGFDWTAINGVVEKVHEELNEVAAAEGADQVESEIGDLLFAVVNYARWLDIDAETALRRANQRFRNRFGAVEHNAAASGSRLTDLSIEEMEKLWQEAKRQNT